jgi:hypothetical protein
MENIKLPLHVLIDSDLDDDPNIERLEFYENSKYLILYHINDKDKAYYISVDIDEEGFINKIARSFHSSVGLSDLPPINTSSNCQQCCNEMRISKDAINLINLLQTISMGLEDRFVLITKNSELIRKENDIKKEFSLLPYSILQPEDAVFFIDLLFKKNNLYLISPENNQIKYRWYETCVRAIITDFFELELLFGTFKNDLKNGVYLWDHFFSLFDRLHDLLYSIDEIGKLTYSYDDPNTNRALVGYHFSYWAILYLGIYDSLAWMAKYRFDLSLANNWDIGLLRNKFRKKLKIIAPELDEYLVSKTTLIRYLSNIRHSIVHRDKPFVNTYITYSGKYIEYAIYIIKDLYDMIVGIANSQSMKLEEWGIVVDGENYILFPYKFAKTSSIALYEFIRHFFKHLQFPKLLEALPEEKRKKYHNFMRGIETNEWRTLLTDFQNANLLIDLLHPLHR